MQKLRKGTLDWVNVENRARNKMLLLRGNFTLAKFEIKCHWKTPRMPRVKEN